MKLHVRRATLGPFETNCYVVRPEGHAGCWIIDAGFEPQALLDAAAALEPSGAVPVEAIIITHAHADHIAGLAEVKAAHPDAPVLLHRAEADWLADPVKNLSAMTGMPVVAPAADRLLDGGETLSLGPTAWRVLNTPGHSPGGITLYCEAAGLAFSGDALFAGSIGRTDLPGSDFRTLERSIRQNLYTLPDATRILPGHGPATTIGQERQSNPFVSG